MSVSKPKWLRHGMYRFEDWSAPDPEDEALDESMHKARYDLKNITQQDAYRILSAAEAYVHLASHPADTKSILQQLRAIRAAVKQTRKG